MELILKKETLLDLESYEVLGFTSKEGLDLEILKNLLNKKSVISISS